MAHPLLPRQGPSSSLPFTLQSGIGTSTIAAAFTAMSENTPNFPTSLPTPGGGSASSILASLQSELSSSSTRKTTPSTLTTSTLPTTTSNKPSSSSLSNISSVTSSETTPTSSTPSSSQTSTVASSSSTGTTTNGATSTSGAASDGNGLTKNEANVGMSAGTKAAIAVPVVLVALVAIILAVFCIRRRKRRRQETGEPAEKVPLASKNKKWTRHLRIFSFDTELLMGGRYSSTNSIRSRETASVRSQAPSQNSHNSEPASVHSVDEVAPPYRDAISSAQPPSIGQVMTGGVAAAAVARSASTATAPPPYGAGAKRLGVPASPASTLGPRDPFSDSTPVSPVDSSPFNDPPGISPAISRNSSVYHAERDDVSAFGGASDAASIREATLARNASVMSGGRIINNVSKS